MYLCLRRSVKIRPLEVYLRGHPCTRSKWVIIMWRRAVQHECRGVC